MGAAFEAEDESELLLTELESASGDTDAFA